MTRDELEAILAGKEREAGQKDRLSSLGRLSTVIAHEIRNPLMIIRASLSTLRRGRVTASALRGAMGGENSQPASYAGDVFREVWSALNEATADLPERGKAGF